MTVRSPLRGLGVAFDAGVFCVRPAVFLDAGGPVFAEVAGGVSVLSDVPATFAAPGPFVTVSPAELSEFETVNVSGELAAIGDASGTGDGVASA